MKSHRIGIFYDGNFLLHASNYYNYIHYQDFTGLFSSAWRKKNKLTRCGAKLPKLTISEGG